MSPMAEIDEQNMAQVQPGAVGGNVAEQTDIPAANESTDRTRQGSVKEAVEKSTPDRGVVDPMEAIAPDPDSHPGA